MKAKTCLPIAIRVLWKRPFLRAAALAADFPWRTAMAEEGGPEDANVRFEGRHFTGAGLLIAIAGTLLLLAACGEKDAAEAVRDLIKKGAELAQKHAVDDLMELTTEDFSASPGTRDAGEVKRILFMAFRHYRTFKIHYPRPSVLFGREEGRARAALYFVIVRRDQPFPDLKDLYRDPERWIEAAREKADLYQLQLDLLKAGDDWKIQKAHLEGFKGYGFQGGRID